MAELEADDLSVLIVDDHDVVHWGFKVLLSKQSWVGSCAGATTAADAIEIVRAGAIDVALVDLFLGRESGADLCEEIRRTSPATRVLLISGAGKISPAAAEAAGASGFISKHWRAADVAMAVRMVARGMTVFEPAAEGPAPLSGRERQVLKLIGDGATNAEIADRLHLSPHTIKDYTSALYRKLEVRNRSEAARRAEQLGLV